MDKRQSTQKMGFARLISQNLGTLSKAAFVP